MKRKSSQDRKLPTTKPKTRPLDEAELERVVGGSGTHHTHWSEWSQWQ